MSDSHITGKSAELLTTGEVARQLRVDPATIRRWINDGTLPAIKVGRGYRIEAHQVQAVIDGHRTSQPLTVPLAPVTRASL